MGENLLCKEQKVTNDNYRDGWERTFKQNSKTDSKFRYCEICEKGIGMFSNSEWIMMNRVCYQCRLRLPFPYITGATE